MGNAANVAPPAVISHTSLPSHIGPIVWISARRSLRVLATVRMSIPTPKSKPSSTKNPIHRTAMRMNQRACRKL